MRLVKKPGQTLDSHKFQQEVFRLWPIADVTTTASSITVSQGNTFILVSAVTNVVVSVPPSSQVRSMEVYVKKVDATANSVTVSGVVADTFDGASNIVWTTRNVSYALLADGSTRWFII